MFCFINFFQPLPVTALKFYFFIISASLTCWNYIQQYRSFVLPELKSLAWFAKKHKKRLPCELSLLPLLRPSPKTFFLRARLQACRSNYALKRWRAQTRHPIWSACYGSNISYTELDFLILFLLRNILFYFFKKLRFYYLLFQAA